MQKNTVRLLSFSALLVVVLPGAVAKVKYPKTTTCPIDGIIAKATGKTKPTLDSQCLTVEYQHKWTDYTNKLHPQRFKHEFWMSFCDNGGTTNPTPGQ